ncbi:MAG: MFS transporter [Clostridia bacterium]|nr:MFS transporter [Clostridia bacterium]
MEKGDERSYIYKVIAAFCIGWAIIYADRTALYPMLKIIGEDFNLTGSQTGAITSAYFLFYVAMQIPAGIWGDKYGLKRILVVMYLLAGIGMLLMGLKATSYVTLLIFIALHGIGAGAYYPAAFGTTLNTVPPETKGISTAVINSGMSLGLVLGLASAGPIYNYFQDWKMPFLVLAVPTILMAFVYQIVIKDIRPSQGEKVPFSAIIKDKNLMLINCAIFCSLYGFWTVVTWGPTFFQAERGMGLTLSGIFTAIVSVTAIPAALTIGRISDCYGRKKLSLILLPLAAACVFATGYATSLTFLVIVLICYGLVGKLTWDPIAISWVGDHVSATKPQAMGTATALFNFSGMLSSIAAPVISGWLKDITGSLQTAFYLGGVIVLLGTLFIAFVDETVNVSSNKTVNISTNNAELK